MNKIVLQDRLYTDVFKIRPLDLLFVIDSSRSMASRITTSGQSKIEAVADSVEQFIAGYTEDDSNINYNIAITTTDADGRLMGGVIRSDTFRSSELREQVRDMQQEAELGLSTSAEKGILASYNVASRSSAMSTYSLNSGFYSKDHDLAVIIISDEDDSSGGACSSVDSCLRALTKMKSGYEGARVTFHAVADDKVKCHTPATIADAPYNSSLKLGANRYQDIVNATGGEFESLCEDNSDGMYIQITSNFDNFFRNIGKNLRKKFKLSIEADPSSFEVFLDGKQQILGQQYDFDSIENALIFNDGYIPRLGEILEIKYGMGTGTQL